MEAQASGSYPVATDHSNSAMEVQASDSLSSSRQQIIATVLSKRRLVVRHCTSTQFFIYLYLLVFSFFLRVCTCIYLKFFMYLHLLSVFTNRLLFPKNSFNRVFISINRCCTTSHNYSYWFNQSSTTYLLLTLS